MILNHTSISAVDVRAVARILVDKFGFAIISESDGHRCVLSPGGGNPAIEINTTREMGPSNGHIGFAFETRALAIEKFKELRGVILNPDKIVLPKTKTTSFPGCFRFFLNGELQIEFGWKDYLVVAH